MHAAIDNWPQNLKNYIVLMKLQLITIANNERGGKDGIEAS